MANMKKASTALLLGNGTNATLTVDDILSKGVTINQGAVIFHIHNTELSNLMRKAKFSLQVLETATIFTAYAILQAFVYRLHGVMKNGKKCYTKATSQHV